MKVIFTIEKDHSCQYIAFNLRVDDRNWNLSIAWSCYHRGKRYPFPVSVRPYFSYQPNIAAIDSDWEKRHETCCGWSLSSHCGRFEGA